MAGSSPEGEQGTPGPLTWFLGVLLERRGRGPSAVLILVVIREGLTGSVKTGPGPSSCQGGTCGLSGVCSRRLTEVRQHAHEGSPGLASLTRGPACLEGAGGPQSCDPTMSPAELRYLPQCALSVCSPPPPPLQVRVRRKWSFVDPLLTWYKRGLPGPRGEDTRLT